MQHRVDGEQTLASISSPSFSIIFQLEIVSVMWPSAAAAFTMSVDDNTPLSQREPRRVPSRAEAHAGSGGGRMVASSAAYALNIDIKRGRCWADESHAYVGGNHGTSTHMCERVDNNSKAQRK